MTKKKTTIAIYLFTFIIFAFIGCLLTAPSSTDELGYLASSAYLSGYDWSEAIANGGGLFYKYFTVVLYVPLFKLIHNPYILYKAIMVEQSALYALIPCIIYDICKRFLKVESDSRAVAMSLITAVLPSALFYNYYARGDSLLIILPWVMLWLMLQTNAWRQKGDNKKQMLGYFLITLVAIALYMTHIRGLICVIAVAMVELIFAGIRLIQNKKADLKWLAVIVVCAILFLIFWKVDKGLNNMFLNTVWRGTTTGNTWESVGELFTGQTSSMDMLKSFIKLVIGTCFGMFTASAGLLYIGFALGCVHFFCTVFGKKIRCNEESIVILFALIYFGGTFLAALLQMRGAAVNYYSGAFFRRGDHIVYERYVAVAMGPICFVGLYLMDAAKKIWNKWTKLLVVVTAGATVGLFVWKIAGTMNCPSFIYANSANLNTFFTIPQRWVFRGDFEGLPLALSYAGIFSFILLLLFLWFQSEWSTKISWVMLGCCLVLIFGVNFKKIRYNFDDEYHKTSEPVVAFFDELSGEGERVYLYQSHCNLFAYQFYLKEEKIFNKASEWKNSTDYFIISNSTEKVAKKLGQDLYRIEELSYDEAEDVDNVYVKGEGLRKSMEEKGYHLRKISLR